MISPVFISLLVDGLLPQQIDGQELVPWLIATLVALNGATLKIIYAEMKKRIKDRDDQVKKLADEIRMLHESQEKMQTEWRDDVRTLAAQASDMGAALNRSTSVIERLEHLI